MRNRRTLALSAAGSFIAVAIGAAAAGAADTIGTVSQPLVAGSEVSAQEQEQQGLVSIFSPAGACSGALLNTRIEEFLPIPALPASELRKPVSEQARKTAQQPVLPVIVSVSAASPMSMIATALRHPKR